ncbi:hypothetical protein [Tuberibacillus calidus]|jgi:hypothetical protein|uniref:hypothetical protein n=1 Tax=Tuberibacillus calidus TaxID=340097 RepID=UPI0004273966|nr:hypothetical protein [Tuberibacillus calidus]
MKKRTFLYVFFIVFVTLVAIARPASAFGGDIIQDDPTTVTQGETVDNVVVFGSDAVIKGHVKGSVIVIDGDLSIEKTASIRDVVLVIGGKILEEPGAKVTDEVINVTFGNGASLGFIVAGILLLTSWSIRLGLSVLLILMVLLMHLILRDKIASFDSFLKERPTYTIVVGAVSWVLITAITILLAITIIGFPAAVVFFLFWLVFFFIGFAVISHRLGRLVIGHEERKPWLNAFYGALVLVSFMNLPFIGCLMAIAMVWLASAYLFLWASRKIKFKT